MKQNLTNIPEVNLSDVKEFWVLGSQHKDGILGEYNLKMNVKAALSGDTNNSGGNTEGEDSIGG